MKRTAIPYILALNEVKNLNSEESVSLHTIKLYSKVVASGTHDKNRASVYAFALFLKSKGPGYLNYRCCFLTVSSLCW